MNAIEFVKTFGWVTAVNLCNKSQECELSEVLFYDSENDKYECVDNEKLKQIVEAWELVERFGGLEESKKLHYDEFCSDTSYNKLQKAINLVEKCK